MLYDWLIKDGKHRLQFLLENLQNETKRREVERELEKKMEEFSKIRFTDSVPFGKNDLTVLETCRLDLKTGTEGIPQIWEAIPSNKSAEIVVSIPEDNTINHLFTILNQYARHNNDREWQMLENFENKINSKSYNIPIADFHHSINEAASESNSQTGILRLGSGKGYYFNSVGLAVYDFQGGAHFKNFLKTYGQTKFNNPDHFPITRLVAKHSWTPLGWVSIKPKPTLPPIIQ